MKFMTLTAAATAMMLSACGGSSSSDAIIDDVVVPVASTVGTVVSNADGSFTITQDGETIALSATNVILNGQGAWRSGFNGGVDNADSFITDDVSAIGGVLGDGTVFSGITGTLGDIPSGDATFEGRYSVTSATSSLNGPLEMTFDLDDNTLTSVAGSDFVVDASVELDGSLTGTVAVSGETVDFEGGFYGDDAVAGAYNNDTIGGVFYGTN